jgi:hypothetical protein
MLHDLLNEIDRFLIGRSSVRWLESWLISRLQSIQNSGDTALIDIANAVDADLVEFGEGLLTMASLREHLQAYLRAADTILIDESRGTRVTTSGASRTIIQEIGMVDGVTTILLPLQRVA